MQIGTDRRYPLRLPGFRHLQLIDCGHHRAKTRTHFTSAGGRHSVHCLHFFPAGAGSWRTGDEAGRLGPGSLLLLRPGQWHWFGPDPGGLVEEFWVRFEGELAATLVAELCPRAVHRRLADPESFRGRFEELLAFAASLCAGPTWRAVTRFVPLLTDLLLAGSELDRVPGEEGADPVDRYAALVHAQVAVREPPLAGFLQGERLGLERFRKHFKARTGLYPHAYWLQARLSHAKRLLHDSPMPVGAVAEALGLDAVYFNQWFRRSTGLSPSAFRSGGNEVRLGD
jgi:hypothetical protein